jgi:phosphatidylethanolamine-binding protein (PEBP) family uncharacterized protein
VPSQQPTLSPSTESPTSPSSQSTTQQPPSQQPTLQPTTAQSSSPTTSLGVSSSTFINGGTLPDTYTCSGAGISPPLSWSGAPEGTVDFVLLMTTPSGPGDVIPVKYNWVLYNIPASTQSLEAGTSGVGTFGVTSDGPNLAYSPPCAQGPGEKLYTFTIYAVSQPATFSVSQSSVTGSLVAAAISGTTLGVGSIVAGSTRFTYSPTSTKPTTSPTVATLKPSLSLSPSAKPSQSPSQS